MDDDRNGRSGDHGLPAYSSPDCELVAHLECDPATCEVRRRLERVTEVQLELTRVAGYAAVSLATLTLPAVVYLDFISHQAGKPWTVPWEVWIVVLSVLCAPFGVKVIIELRKVLPWVKNGR